jgi:hypothetical protein
MHSAIVSLFKQALFHPASEFELVLAAALAGTAFVMTLNAVGGAANMPLAQSGRSLAALIAWVVIELVILAAVRVYATVPVWAEGAIAVAIVLAIGVPLVCLLLKSDYVSALFALALAIAAAAAVAMFVHTGFNTVRGGEGSIDLGRRHKHETEEFLKR